MKPVNHKPAFPSVVWIQPINTNFAHVRKQQMTLEILVHKHASECLLIILTVLSNPDSWPSYILCIINLDHGVSLCNFYKTFIALHGQIKPWLCQELEQEFGWRGHGGCLPPAVTHYPNWTCTYIPVSSCTPCVPWMKCVWSTDCFMPSGFRCHCQLSPALQLFLSPFKASQKKLA